MGRPGRSRGVLTLCYHAVSPGWTADLSITPAQLDAQLRLLLARGYRGVTFQEAVSSPRERTLAVTFDDGLRSVYEHGRPVLDRLGVPGTVFVVTDYVGESSPMRWAGIEQWLATPSAH